MSKNTDLAGYDTSLPVANLIATGTLSIELNVTINTSTIFVGNSPFIQSIQPTLNLSNNQIDNLFISASKIT